LFVIGRIIILKSYTFILSLKIANIDNSKYNLGTINNIVFIGAGNVADVLAQAFVRAGLKVSQVYSRTYNNAVYLANKVGAEPLSEINNIIDADLYLFCVSDSAIQLILEQRNWQDKFLVHTAGSVPLDIFKPFSNKYGVIYPLQTFTKDRLVNVAQIPLFIEASSQAGVDELKSIMSIVFENIMFTSSDQRQKIHLAGVFANNFANYMFTIATEILQNEFLPIEFLKPLMEETFQKASDMGSIKAQTGPAIRNNKEIIQKHSELLASHSDWQKIYTFVTESIQKYYHTNG
jgi:predicted short-subunit dehydrogenase-like oxidoreductase (DUF2520 family)